MNRVLPVPPGPTTRKDARLALVPDGNRLEKLALTAEEGGGRDRKVDRAGRPQRRERRVAELEDPYEALEVLHAMLPEVRHRHVSGEERSGRLGDENLPSMGEPGHAGSPMDVHPHVTLGRERRCPRVEPHANADRTACERLLPVQGRIHRVSGGGERDEECVALRVDLDAAVGRECLPEQATVLRERLGIAPRARARAAAASIPRCP